MYVIIVGCGRVGSQLANLLSEEGHNVVVVDKNSAAFKRLGSRFNGATFTGNGYELAMLKEAGVERADIFCSLTDGDNTNIMAAQVAKKIFGVSRVIARVYDSSRAEFYKTFDLEIISGTVLFAALIRDKIIDKHLSSFLIRSKDVGLIEFDVTATLIGKAVANVNIRDEFMIISLVRNPGQRNQKAIIPSADTVFEEDTKVYGVVSIDSLKKVKKVLGLKE